MHTGERDNDVTDVDTTREWAVVGDRIRLAREAAGISVRELARRVDVSASHVSQVERGLASFSVRSLYNVVSILGVSMDSLFEDATTPAGAKLTEAPDVIGVAAEGGPLDEAGVVLRRGSRPTLQMQLRLLSSRHLHQLHLISAPLHMPVL